MNKQPPFVKAPLYTRIEALKAEALARNATSIQSSQRTNQTKYIHTEIKAWITSLNPDQLSKRYSTKEIISLAKLTGKHRETPSFQQVAKALRSLGFQNKRSWTNSSRNQRYWIFKGE